MAIKDWPAAERPREKLLTKGPESLSDAELLAIFLRTGVAGQSAVDVARECLQRFGGVRELMLSKAADFCRQPGLGSAKYASLQAVFELSKRALSEEMRQQCVIASPAATRRYLQAALAGESREVFWCLYLDNQHRVIASEALFYGTLDGAAIYPREVVKACLQHNAAAVIFAHNHPSGVAEPSQSDHAITRRLVEALGLVEVRVLDHLVIGDGGWVSLASRGAL